MITSVIVVGGIAVTAWLAFTTYCMNDVLSTASAVGGMSTLLPFFLFFPEISCATNQIGERVLQSRGELDGVASP